MSPNLPHERGYAHDSLSPPEQPPPSRRRKLLWGAGALAFVLVLTFIVHQRLSSSAAGGNLRGGFGRQGLAVGVARVTSGDVPITIDSIGTVTPLATVTVHPQVTGPLVKIDFAEGQLVKAGDVLAEIDPRPFQASLDQAQGQMAHDRALLANAQVDLDRYKTLVEQNSVAEQTYATQQATVLQDQATVTADTATVETARLNLSYCQIRSPVAGTVGLRQVDMGNVVSAYSTSIVVVTQLQPMSVLFTIPEDNLSEVVRRLHDGEKLVAAAYDRTFTTVLDKGVLANTDNEIDTTTGTLKLRAMFANTEGELFPSQFVNVRLTLDTLHDQLLVPTVAVRQGATGNYVYLVAADPPGVPSASVHVRYVTTGPTVGDLISIRSGLQLSDTVVIEGADQLRDGAFITVQGNSPSGAADSAPGAAGGDSGDRNAQGRGPGGIGPGGKGRGSKGRKGRPGDGGRGPGSPPQQ